MTTIRSRVLMAVAGAALLAARGSSTTTTSSPAVGRTASSRPPRLRALSRDDGCQGVQAVAADRDLAQQRQRSIRRSVEGERAAGPQHADP
jgi:hypothetical protein